MIVQHQISLLPFNTFKIDVQTKNLVHLERIEDIPELLGSGFLKSTFFILGGGSNILLTKDFDGTMIHPVFKGIEKVKETSDHIWIKVYAGEIWDRFVDYCVSHNFGGIENLSLIPGQCGTAPVQNIGAFGVEVKDTIVEVEIINLLTGEKKILSNEECQFGYRNSIFKSQYKSSWLIISTTYKLTTNKHEYHTQYGNIADELKKYSEINLTSIRESVIKIRTSKLPDPSEIGNAGSFFKNPIVHKNIADQIRTKYPNAPTYPVNEKETKLAAGWIIEQCGWKGKKRGNAGVHDKQALVLINNGNASGTEIIELCKEIQKSVLAEFNIELEPEVNFL